jgi:UDP-2-acetamido-3-amino-2,3-dideoxy-glucuronate N-acetyltransferase
VAAPARAHFELAKRLLSYGLHVLVEKPLALEASQGEELVAAADAAGLVLQVGHVLEHHPARRVLEEAVAAGEIGEVRHARFVRANLGTVRSVEDVLWSFAPHDIACAVALAGGPPTAVYAHGFDLLSRGLADAAVAVLEFGSRPGFTAHLGVSWLEPEKEHKLVLVGSRGMITWDDSPARRGLWLHRYRTGRGVGEVRVGLLEKRSLPVPEGEPLKLELAAFADAVRSGGRPRGDAAGGLTVLRVLQACRRSMAERRAVAVAEEKYYRHETAVVDEGAVVGEGSRVWHFVHVNQGAKVGRDVVLGQSCFVADGAVVGDRCRVQNNVSVYRGVTLEEDVFVGPSAVFTNVRHPRAFVSRRDEYAATRVGKGASIGANATIVCGVTIGEHAFVAAGAVVTKDVPPHALVAGVPAQVVGYACTCGERVRVPEESACSRCGEHIKWVDPPGVRARGWPGGGPRTKR